MSKQPGGWATPEQVATAVVHLQEATDLIDSAAARVLKVNRTDLAILGILSTRGPRTAGELAEAAGLSPAATTAALDRLEQAGHLIRGRDDRDGRRRTARLSDQTAADIDTIYGPVGRDGLATLAAYSTEELTLIHAFLERGAELQRRHARRINAINK